MAKNITSGEMKNLIKGVINEQGLVFICEPGNCQCQPEIFGGGGATTYISIADCQNDLYNCCTRYVCDRTTNYQCAATGDPNAPFASMNDCQLAHPNGCAPQQEFDCNASTGYVCAAFPGGQYSTMGQCLSVHPQGCAPPADDYDCVRTPTGGFTCVVQPGGPFTGPNAQADCNAAVANQTAPCNPQGDPRSYDCDIENCQCVQTQGGYFTGPTALQDCNNALQDPDHECCCINCDPIDPCETLMNDPNYGPCCESCRGSGGQLPISDPCAPFCKCCKYDCVDRDGQIVCVQDPNGQFPNLSTCQAAVADPDSKCYDPGSGGGWDCLKDQGCVDTGSGPYPDQATCEANSDDHYNIGGTCECICPGQPEGCDAAVLPSNVPVINGEYAGMHGQPFPVGFIGLDLNIAKDKNGPLLTQAFRDRMSPCGPSYRAPGGNVKHDCAFWEFVSTKKLPNKYYSVITPASQGGLASPNAESPWQMAHSTAPASGGTALGGYPFHAWDPGPDGIQGTADDTPMIHADTGDPINPYGGQQSTTAHPRWQRRIEAKIAYIRCLRENCCSNTEWPNDGGSFDPYL